MPSVLRDRPEIELLDGQRYPKVSPKLNHSIVQGSMLVVLRRCAGSRGLSGTELRCRLEPGTEFVPDVAYIAFDRLHAVPQYERQEPPFAPDVAVEVRSPSNRERYEAKKIATYLKHGSLLVLDIDPAMRTLRAHTDDGEVRAFHAGEAFESRTVPWLRFNVAELFEGIEEE